MKKSFFSAALLSTLLLLATSPAQAAITTPTPNSTLVSDSVTFEWEDIGATESFIRIRTNMTEPDRYIWYSGFMPPNQTSVTATGLPEAGEKLYVKLFQKVGGVWQDYDYIYTASSVGPKIPAMLSPTPGSILNSSTVTFEWEESNASRINIKFGTGFYLGTEIAKYGQYDLFGKNAITLNNLPTDGSAVFVTFNAYIDGQWLQTRYIYTSTY